MGLEVEGVSKVTGKGELIAVKSFAVGLVAVDTTYVTIINVFAPNHEGLGICTDPAYLIHIHSSTQW